MASPNGSVITSLHGIKLGITDRGNLVGEGDYSPVPGIPVQLTSPTADGVITVGAEVSDVRAITVQLYDVNGNKVNYAAKVELVMYLDATGTQFAATGGSTGIAIGANGKLLQIVAKKVWKAITDITGKLTLTWTDTGTEVAYLGVHLPTGRTLMSVALTNA